MVWFGGGGGVNKKIFIASMKFREKKREGEKKMLAQAALVFCAIDIRR